MAQDIRPEDLRTCVSCGDKVHYRAIYAEGPWHHCPVCLEAAKERMLGGLSGEELKDARNRYML